MLELLLSLLILAGAIFTFIGALGLARLPDFYTRLHAPTKATTLGVGSLLIASAIYFSTQGPGVSLHEILVTLFLFINLYISISCFCLCRLYTECNQFIRTRSKLKSFQNSFPKAFYI